MRASTATIRGNAVTELRAYVNVTLDSWPHPSTWRDGESNHLLKLTNTGKTPAKDVRAPVHRHAAPPVVVSASSRLRERTAANLDAIVPSLTARAALLKRAGHLADVGNAPALRYRASLVCSSFASPAGFVSYKTLCLCPPFTSAIHTPEEGARDWGLRSSSPGTKPTLGMAANG
jgi:hypothetical protein